MPRHESPRDLLALPIPPGSGIVQRITQPLPHALILEIYAHGTRRKWLFSAHPQHPCITPTTRHPTNPKLPPSFCLWLRTRVLHCCIVLCHM